MTLLLLIRHGENDYTQKHKLAGRLPGVHLNGRGKSQAEALAMALAKVPVQAIYSSPLERARETAAFIAKAHKLKVRLSAGLIETNVGKWQGRSLAALRLNKHWKVVQHSPSRAFFPEGETFYECQARVVAALDKIIRHHRPNDVIACVFHADPIKLAVSHYLGLPIDNFQRLSCDTASVTVLAIDDMGGNLIKSNQRPPFDFPVGRKK